jgi:hypothetical protein
MEPDLGHGNRASSGFQSKGLDGTLGRWLSHRSVFYNGANMQRYATVSGAFFVLVACAQLLRVIMQWPVRVATFDVPLWASGVAVLIAGSLAVWAFRLMSARPNAGGGR